MCRFKAASTPTMVNTTRTPANSQRNDRFFSASASSVNIRITAPEADTLTAGPCAFGRNGIRDRVPQAEPRIEHTINSDMHRAKGL